MNKRAFDIDKFNVIEDRENYYVFRALNNGDHNDIINNIISNENGISRIRTDRERFEEDGITAKYNEDSIISLEEVYDHIKIRYIKETNCISLSSNPNVSIDYGQSYNEEYVMVKVPKENESNVYNAGQYMLEEIEKRINKTLETISPDSELIGIINQIDSEENFSNVKTIIEETYDEIKKISDSNFRKDNEYIQKASVIDRFDRKQYFSDEQQLEYNKIIAKLSVLEASGNLKSIISTQRDNSSLIGTVGMAFSSGELIHYKDIKESELVNVSKEMMDILSLTQQIRDKYGNSESIKNVEDKILGYINDGYEFVENNEELILTNGKEKIRLNNVSNFQQAQKEISVEDIYKLTKGKVSYEKAKIAIQMTKKLSQSKLRALEYADIIKTLTNADDQLIDKIKNETYTIDKDIISRENNDGFKIAESVNIGLTRDQKHFVSNKEQIKIKEKIESLNKDQLKEIVETNGEKIQSELLSDLTEINEEVTENMYFAEVIVNGLDFNKIYNTIQGNREKTEQEHKTLVGYLENVDCKKLYNAFINAGVKQNEISGFVTNLLLNDGYKGYSLEELSKLDNLDEIVSTNVKNENLKNAISPLKLDDILGIKDDLYQVENTGINLRDYQNETYNNIENIFNDKRFAGMVLPTGAGKSFVAMTEIMKFKNQDSHNESGNSNVIFVAPQNAILHQFQVHVLKNVLNRKIITEEEIEQLEKEGKPIPKNVVQPKDFKKVLNQEFPSLKMFCYASLNDKDEEWLQAKDADLIILDELHRTGAKTWEPKIQRLLELNPKAKVLGMTATPIRDVDGKDMARTLAEMTGEYTTKELNNKDYLASEMHLLDAMQDQYVVSPKVVTFDYTLKDFDEYNEVKRMLEEEKDPVKKEELERVYKEMTNIIKSSEKEGMKGILAKNIKKTNGKYIVFLPQNPNSDKRTSEEYIKEQIEKVKEDFIEVNPNIKTSYLLSDRENASQENAKALAEFEKSTPDELQLLFAVDMLNEGVHVDNIDGAVMLRPINENSKILYLQQIGRCIFSEDPLNPTPDEDRPIIFDVYNNYLAHNIDREANKTTSTSDLQRLQAISNWISKHNGYIPDINSEYTKEAKKAATLKHIQGKYFKYLDGIENKNFSESEIYEIEKILDLGKKIQLWDLEIPERITLPGEKDLLRNETFKVTGTQREFMDLFKKAKVIEKDKKINDNLRIKNTLSVLDYLSEHGVEINNERLRKYSKLRDILKFMPENEKEEILSEISVDESFEIGEEYTFAKKGFYNGRKLFAQYDVKDLRKYGMFEDFEYSGKTYKAVEDGFIVRGPKDLKELNIYTGTLYNESGYNIEGYNSTYFRKDEKINKFGFRRDGIHEETGTKLNLYGFDVYGNYYEIQKNGEYINTEKRINPEGFDIEGYYYEKQEDGKYKNTFTHRDDEGFDIRGVNLDGFKRDGIHEETGTKLNPYDFDKEGYYYEKQEDGTYFNTGKKISKEGFDTHGYYWEKQEDGQYKNTYNKYNHEGFDLKGYYWETKYNFGGSRKNTYKKYNSEGFDVRGVNEDGFRKDGIHEKTGTKLNPYNFDIDGYYYEKQEDGTYLNTSKKENSYGFDLKKHYHKTSDIDPDGYNFYNVNEKGFGRDGYYYEEQEDGTYFNTGKKINNENFDKDGYYYKKQEDGTYLNTGKKIDLEGYDIDGYDRCNFKKGSDNWINKDGFGRDKHYYEYDLETHEYVDTGKECDKAGYNIYGVNEDGFNKDGYYYEKQEDGSYINTEKIVNSRGFNRFGHYCEYRDGEYIDTYSIFDPEGYDVKGLDSNGFTKYSEINNHGFYRDGTHSETGLKYDKNGFGMNNIHVITKSFVDLNDFDINGKCRKNDYKEYNKRGFKQDGTHKDTGEKYYNGYNTYGVDEEGKNMLGKKHPDIVFAEKYIEAVMSGKRMQYLKENCKINQSNKDKVMQEADIKLCRAVEMYPKLKQKIVFDTVHLKRAIKQREKKIAEIQGNTAAEKSAIKKLQDENEILKQRLTSIDPINKIEDIER